MHENIITLVGEGGTIRRGIPAYKFSGSADSVSRDSPDILRILQVGDIFGVGCITFISILSVSSISILGGQKGRLLQDPKRGTGSLRSLENSPFTATISECLTAVGKYISGSDRDRFKLTGVL